MAEQTSDLIKTWEPKMCQREGSVRRVESSYPFPEVVETAVPRHWRPPAPRVWTDVRPRPGAHPLVNAPRPRREPVPLPRDLMSAVPARRDPPVVCP